MNQLDRLQAKIDRKRQEAEAERKRMNPLTPQDFERKKDLPPQPPKPAALTEADVPYCAHHDINRGPSAR